LQLLQLQCDASRSFHAERGKGWLTSIGLEVQHMNAGNIQGIDVMPLFTEALTE
jgi:hypothetical protein